MFYSVQHDDDSVGAFDDKHTEVAPSVRNSALGSAGAGMMSHPGRAPLAELALNPTLLPMFTLAEASRGRQADLLREAAMSREQQMQRNAEAMCLATEAAYQAGLRAGMKQSRE